MRYPCVRLIRIVACAIGFGIGATACEKERPDVPSKQPEQTVSSDSQLFLLIVRYEQGLFPEHMDTSDPSPPGPPLVLAIWSDGRVVFRRELEGRHPDYVQGHLSAVQLGILQSAIADIVQRSRGSRVAVSSSFEECYYRFKNRVRVIAESDNVLEAREQSTIDAIKTVVLSENLNGQETLREAPRVDGFIASVRAQAEGGANGQKPF